MSVVITSLSIPSPLMKKVDWRPEVAAEVVFFDAPFCLLVMMSTIVRLMEEEKVRLKSPTDEGRMIETEHVSREPVVQGSPVGSKYWSLYCGNEKGFEEGKAVGRVTRVQSKNGGSGEALQPNTLAMVCLWIQLADPGAIPWKIMGQWQSNRRVAVKWVAVDMSCFVWVGAGKFASVACK
jgi:hypothetical protein